MDWFRILEISYAMADPSSGIISLRWTVEDEQRLLLGTEAYGLNNWWSVAQTFNGRFSSEECEEHFFQVYPSEPLGQNQLPNSMHVTVFEAKWNAYLNNGTGLDDTFQGSIPGLTTWRMENLEQHAEESIKALGDERISKLVVEISAGIGEQNLTVHIAVWQAEP